MFGVGLLSLTRCFPKSSKCPMGWIKRPHVLQILQIWKHKLSLCFSRICQDRQWDSAPHGSMQVCIFIRLNATQHACGLSGKDLFVVNQKRDQECTTRPPTSCHVSYSSHILAPIHWFLSSRLSLSPPLSFLIPSCLFALKKYQLFISQCLYFMDSTMECMGGNLYKPVWEIPRWLAKPLLFCTQEFMLTN